MYKGKLLLVTAAGLILSMSVFTGCGKKPVPEPVKQEVKAPETKPAPPVVVPKEPEKVAPREEGVPSGLAFDTVYFDYDKFNLRDDQVGAAESNAQLLAKYGTVKIRLEGNCDERGSEEYNLALGQRRADAVRSYLVNYGISTSRLETISYGEMRPAVQGANEEAWAKNRRVDSVITER